MNKHNTQAGPSAQVQPATTDSRSCVSHGKRGVVELERRVTALDGSATLPGWWPGLFERAESASIFLSPAWIQTWLEVYGHEFSGFWVCWRLEGETVGGCLILQRTVWRRHWPVATLFVNMADETRQRSHPIEFNQILHVGGYEEPIGRDLAKVIAGRGWSRFELAGYEDSPLARLVLKQLPVCHVEHEERPSPYVDLTAIVDCDYEATLSSKTRWQIRRSRRIYEEMYGPVVIEPASDCDQAIAFLTQLAVLHNATWKSRGLDGAFVSRTLVDFEHRLIRRLSAVRGVDVLRVRAGEKVIGYLYTFLYRGKVYFVQSGFVQEENKHLKPGMLSHASAIRYYCEKGYREYDFLAGDMRYKRSLAKSERRLAWSIAYRRGVYTRLLLAASKLRQRFAGMNPVRGRLLPARVASAEASPD